MERSMRAAALCLFLLAAAGSAAAQHGDMTATDIPPLSDGLGNLHHAVTTSSPLAQQYFDQGLRLAYAFNHEEAIRSFRQAAALDPACAMAHWGAALALGPNINQPMDAAAESAGVIEEGRALALADGASPAEREYIHALALRYGPPGGSRAGRDSAYAAAMREVARRHADDPDAQALFAESMLDLAPWNQWTLAGRPLPGTNEVVATLERGLKRWPDHIGLIHYYVHAIEESPYPERALPYADRLASLAPAAGHLVHMASHLYRLAGRYEDALALNERAAEVDHAYLDKRGAPTMYGYMYLSHNLDFIAATAAMLGRSAVALGAADQLEKNLRLDLIVQFPPAEFLAPIRLELLARFGRWSDILALPQPPAALRYTSGMWRYARGLALVAAGKPDEAAVELDSLRAVRAAMPGDYLVSLNAGDSVLTVAVETLAGRLASARGANDDAIAHLRRAVATEDRLHYDEPPTWYYPVRHSLGAALLRAGRAREAEAVYREDLRRNPGNGWALYGLARALEARGARGETRQTEARFHGAWAKADVTISSSEY